MRRWLPIPTARTVAVAVAAAIVVLALPLAPILALVIVNGALLVAVVVDTAVAVPPSSLTVRRDLPGTMPLGGTASLRWSVRAAGRGCHVRIADALPPSLGAVQRRAHLAVPAGGRATASTTLRPQRRGRFQLDAITVRIRGPWGLGSTQTDLSVPSSLRVLPSFRSRDEVALRLDRARLLDVGLRSARGRGGGTEFDSLRAYGVDDEFRRIDWNATARAGEPIVREYRAERNQTVVALLDTGRLMAGRVVGATVRVPDGGGMPPPRDEVPRLDHAMDALLALVTVTDRLGDRLGLVAFADEVRAVVPAGHTAAQLRRISEAVYALEPQLTESDYRGAFLHTLARFRRRTLLVLFTELQEEALTETLLPALPLIARDHVVIVCSVRDPEVEAWASTAPSTAAQAYRQAAAVDALATRRRIAAQLGRRGATVVDGPPGRVAGDLVDVYLRIKAAGRL